MLRKSPDLYEITQIRNYSRRQTGYHQENKTGWFTLSTFEVQGITRLDKTYTVYAPITLPKCYTTADYMSMQRSCMIYPTLITPKRNIPGDITPPILLKRQLYIN